MVRVGTVMRINDRDKFVKLANNRVSKTIKSLQLVGNLANKSNYDYTPEDVAQIFSALEEELKHCRQRFLNSDSKQTSGSEFNLSNELASESFMSLGDRLVADMLPAKAEKAYKSAWQ